MNNAKRPILADDVEPLPGYELTIEDIQFREDTDWIGEYEGIEEDE